MTCITLSKSRFLHFTGEQKQYFFLLFYKWIEVAITVFTYDVFHFFVYENNC
jgi:hypothetical protein